MQNDGIQTLIPPLHAEILRLSQAAMLGTGEERSRHMTEAMEIREITKALMLVPADPEAVGRVVPTATTLRVLKTMGIVVKDGQDLLWDLTTLITQCEATGFVTRRQLESAMDTWLDKSTAESVRGYTTAKNGGRTHGPLTIPQVAAYARSMSQTTVAATLFRQGAKVFSEPASAYTHIRLLEAYGRAIESPLSAPVLVSAYLAAIGNTPQASWASTWFVGNPTQDYHTLADRVALINIIVVSFVWVRFPRKHKEHRLRYLFFCSFSTSSP
jgi:hypothetical protein